MANFLMKNPKCVFIHITKTGGTSIRKGVWKDVPRQRVFGHIPDAWQKLFSFAFVRDPIDRFFSAYRMFTQGTYNTPQEHIAKGTRQLSLEAFIDIVLDETIIYDERRRKFEERVRHHTIPQTHPFNCLEYAKFVGRFWAMDEDFDKVCARLDFRGTLPRIHYTRKSQDLSLSPAQAQVLKAYYAEDYDFIENRLPDLNR